MLSLFPAKAEEIVYPGNPDHPGFGNMIYFEYESVLIRLIQQMDGSESSRQAVITRINEHPEEVNDWWNHDGWSGTPLTEAMQRKDKEIVSLLLANGAIPFPPPGGSFWKNRAEGNPEYAEILSTLLFWTLRRNTPFIPVCCTPMRIGSVTARSNATISAPTTGQNTILQLSFHAIGNKKCRKLATKCPPRASIYVKKRTFCNFLLRIRSGEVLSYVKEIENDQIFFVPVVYTELHVL